MDSGLKINPIFNYPRNLQSLLFAIFNMYYMYRFLFSSVILKTTQILHQFLSIIYLCNVKLKINRFHKCKCIFTKYSHLYLPNETNVDK